MVLGGIKSRNFEMVHILYPTKKIHCSINLFFWGEEGVVHIQPYFTKPLDLAVFFFLKALIVGGWHFRGS